MVIHAINETVNEQRILNVTALAKCVYPYIHGY